MLDSGRKMTIKCLKHLKIGQRLPLKFEKLGNNFKHVFTPIKWCTVNTSCIKIQQ